MGLSRLGQANGTISSHRGGATEQKGPNMSYKWTLQEEPQKEDREIVAPTYSAGTVRREEEERKPKEERQPKIKSPTFTPGSALRPA